MTVKEPQWLTDRTKTFNPSLICEISKLAEKYNAINLSEGFPDYPAPNFLKEAGIRAILEDFNQYRYVQEICEEVGQKFTAASGVAVHGPSQVSICCGQSGAFSAAVLAVVGPGDEVLILEPSYETYSACVLAAGGTPKFVHLPPPDWTVSRELLEGSLCSQTKAIVVNSPNNPTGRVLSQSELSAISEFCVAHDILAITDEVYEHFVYGGNKHLSLASFPGMKDRTIVTSSISKTFGVTGWRVGWAISPTPEICSAIDKLHCKFVDSPPAPFQEAALTALRSPPAYYETLKMEYEKKRELACEALTAAGFLISCVPEGGMFIFAEIPEAFLGNDVDFAKELIMVAGVAVVPGSNFFHENDHVADVPILGSIQSLPVQCNGSSAYSNNGCETKSRASPASRYVRVAFCKSESTLQAAAQALRHFSC